MENLIDVQNRIVDPHFQDSDYRTSQSYVGQSISYQKQLVHYVCPKPDDLTDMMDRPDRLIDLFIQLCLQNNGRLSAGKRESHFGLLTDAELADMENAVRAGYVR